MDVQTLSVFGLAAFAVGGLLWVFVYPILSGERKTEKRMASVARTEPVAVRTARTTQKSRRDTVESTLKDIEERHKKQKKMPLNVRIQQAGLSWSKRQFYIISGIIGAVLFVIVLFSGTGLIPAFALGLCRGVRVAALAALLFEKAA